MILSKKYKMLFVHIPRTAGLAITYAIQQQDEVSKYITREAKLPGPHAVMTKEISEKYKDYIKFSVIRNPWMSCLSTYLRFYMLKDGMLFKDWLYSLLDIDSREFYPFPEQRPFLYNGDTCLVDFIFRYKENIQVDLDAYFIGKHKLDINFSETLYNRQPNSNGCYKHLINEYYTDTEKTLVYELCKEDIEFFNWKFPENENE